MKHEYEIGDEVVIAACPVLGNDPEPAVVVSLESYGYRVRDSLGWVGPVNFELKPLQDF